MCISINTYFLFVDSNKLFIPHPNKFTNLINSREIILQPLIYCNAVIQ